VESRSSAGCEEVLLVNSFGTGDREIGKRGRLHRYAAAAVILLSAAGVRAGDDLRYLKIEGHGSRAMVVQCPGQVCNPGLLTPGAYQLSVVTRDGAADNSGPFSLRVTLTPKSEAGPGGGSVVRGPLAPEPEIATPAALEPVIVELQQTDPATPVDLRVPPDGEDLEPDAPAPPWSVEVELVPLG
jgi:hypothetical protein